MRTVERMADRCLGHLGLFLIGVMGWVADRMEPAPQPAPRARTRRVSPHPTRRAEA
jgi:hypothetical protein